MKEPKEKVVFDVECYSNYFLVLFKRLCDGRIFKFELTPKQHLDIEGLNEVLTNYTLIGFNSNDYDLPIIRVALKGYSNIELKRASDDIITNFKSPQEFAKENKLYQHNYDHIDLINVAPLKASLKIYAGRLHCRKMQDLPYDAAKKLKPEEIERLVEYCGNDLDNTELLYYELVPEIEIRENLNEQAGQDLRSKGGAQVAERVISARVQKLTGNKIETPKIDVGTKYKYKMPAYINFTSPDLIKLKSVIERTEFTVSDSGSIELPKELSSMVVKVANKRYTIGIGGLHSCETQVSYLSGEDGVLTDDDVASYYPRIILTLGLFPQHIGPEFLEVYKDIFEQRIAAKKSGNKILADSYKLLLNSSFGLFGSKFSRFYSPDLLIQVTITGQLALLMLIEWFENEGIPVISANTDGVLAYPKPDDKQKLLDIIDVWEFVTGFVMEEAQYKSYYARDINNYVAIKDNGEVKSKGQYSNPWEKDGPNIFKLHKNPSTTIVIDAVIARLREGTPLEDTIKACRDIRKFIAVRKVTGGANDSDGEYLGKAIRWYYATDQHRATIGYKTSSNKVPKSEGAKPLMELPDELPDDINYDWYVQEAEIVLIDIGYSQQTLFAMV